ncbi:MAG: hypothetical protein RJA52_741 [Bacteroidota bacterium]|jgi:hypothetical protein
MNIFRKLIFLSAFSMSVFACSNSSVDSKSEESTIQEEEEKGPEYTSAYICPMHCEGSGSSEPGKCPVCGMDYVANTDN